MKAQYLVPIIAIMLVISVSGCIEGFEGFTSIFGGPEQPAIEQKPDIIIMKGLSVIPTPPVMAESEFTLLFTMKNQDESVSIKDVNVKLYNWGICEPEEIDIDGAAYADFLPDAEKWTTADEAKDLGYYLRTFDEFVPREEKVIEWNFEAPTNARIGRIEADCPIKWEIDYTFSARSQDDFAVISETQKKQMDRAGLVWEGTDQAQYVGSGPVTIYYDFKTDMPVQSLSSIQYTLTVVDRGVGIYPKVETGTMFIKVPKEWIENVDIADKACTDTFALVEAGSGEESAPAKKEVKTEETDGEGNIVEKADIIDINAAVENDYVIYNNVKPITLHQRESPEIICRFKAPDLDEINIPERTYFFSSNITDYSYRLTDEKTIHIKPTLE